MKKVRAKMNERKDILSRYTSYSRDELVKELDLQISILPEDERASVRFEVDTDSQPYDSSEYPKLFMTWERQETDKEMEQRYMLAEQYDQGRKQRELAEFKRLEKLYGNKK